MAVRLYRPVGANELAAIEQLAWRRFPPRLPEQPIFYPVLNFDYAAQIARNWNSSREPNSVGYVLEFDVGDAVARRYPMQTAGIAGVHQELWVPAGDLESFNDGIQGEIRLVATYRQGERVEA